MHAQSYGTYPAPYQLGHITVTEAVPNQHTAVRTTSSCLVGHHSSRCGIDDVRPALDAWSHRRLSTRSTKHPPRCDCSTPPAYSAKPKTPRRSHLMHDALPLVLVLNLERATKFPHVTLALLQSSDNPCSRQGKYNKFDSGELGNLPK